MTLRFFRSITSAAVALAALAACSDTTPTQVAIPHDAHVSAMSNSGRNGAEIGQTGGWADGKTVTFHYNKPFFCAPGSTSAATSGCILGEEPSSQPRGGKIPVLYVMGPLLAGVDPATLQCPTAGQCINHPSTIDLSPVFGSGTQNALLPPHSHIVGDDDTTRQGANAGWWEIEVIGAPTPEAWNAIVEGKSLRTARALRAQNKLTGDIPTNLFLFFSVNRSGT